MSRIEYVPAEIKRNDISLLRELTQLLPKSETPQKYNSYNPGKFDLQAWIDKYNIPVAEKTNWQGGTKWILKECPFDSNHKGKDASIIQTADGKICYNCFHSSCSGNHWKEFRQLYEPDAYTKQIQTKPVPNYKNSKLCS
jgi:hypothetical protein